MACIVPTRFEAISTNAERVALWRSAVAGDREARDALACSLWPIILKRAATLYDYRVRNAGYEPQDIASEVVVRILGHLHKFDPDRGSFLAWTFLNFLNVISGILRRKSWRHLASNPQAAAVLSPHADPADSLNEDTGELADAALSALTALPSATREIVLRYCIDRETLTEIADSLGISVPVAKCRLQRGRRILRPSLAEFI